MVNMNKNMIPSSEGLEKKKEEEKEALEKFKIFVYSKDYSFIIDNPDDEEACWEFTPYERKLLNSKERENFLHELSKDTKKPSQKRKDFTKLPNLQSNENKIFFEYIYFLFSV